jgi:thiosulfate/3-mercaptopyruvate sulfurtransferase
MDMLARLAATFLLLALAATAHAAGSTIVDTAYVAQAVERGALVWDTRATAAYDQGHIPGAVSVGDVGTVLRDPNTEDYIAVTEIARILGGAGIDPSREIVVYGAKADPYVYFGLVTLQYLGARDARIYHGGIQDWKAAGHAVSTEPTRIAAVEFTPHPDPGMLVETREVVQRLHDPDVQILDVRTPKEYRGEDIRAIRGGHIPGAIPLHYMENWADPEAQDKLQRKLTTSHEGLDLKPRERLQALYAKLDPSKETIVYCQSGIRASETATILKDLGFSKVRVYDSSWLGYGNTLDAPAENVVFFSVGAMQARMGALQKRVDALEKELAEARHPK